MQTRESLSLWDPRLSRSVMQEGVLCRRYTHPNGFSSRLHAHAGTEIVFSADGEGIFHIAGKDYPVSPGVLLIFPASLPHQPMVTRNYSRWNLCILPSYLEDGSGLTQTVVYEHMTFNAERKINSIFSDIKLETAAQYGDKDRYIQLLIKQFTMWFRRGQTERRESYPEPSPIDKVNTLSVLTNYIESHLHADLRVEKLAEAVNYSPSHIWRIIHSTTGHSPVEYITSLRLNRARVLLCQSKQSIGSIAHMVGFRTAAYFSRVFKEKMGCTPSEYRANFR